MARDQCAGSGAGANVVADAGDPDQTANYNVSSYYDTTTAAGAIASANTSTSPASRTTAGANRRFCRGTAMV